MTQLLLGKHFSFKKMVIKASNFSLIVMNRLAFDKTLKRQLHPPLGRLRSTRFADYNIAAALIL